MTTPYQNYQQQHAATFGWPDVAHLVNAATRPARPRPAANGVISVNLGQRPTPARLPSQGAATSHQVGRPRPVSQAATSHQIANRPGVRPSRGSSSSAGGSNRGGSTGGSRAGSGSNAGSGTSSAPSRTVRRPLTFTDSRGTVHRVRRTSSSTAAAGQAKPTKDPLEALVDEMLAGQALPLENDKKALVEQSAGNVNQLNRLHDFYGNQVEGVRTGANADFGAMLQRAAELKGISADTIAKNQEWLRSLAGPSNGGTLDAQAGQSGAETLANVAGANDSLARDISAQGTSLNDTMAQLEVAGRAAQRDAVQQEMLARDAGVRETDRSIAELRARRPEMLYQMRAQAADQALKQQVAEAEWGLKQQQANSLDAYRQGQLALGAARLEQGGQQGAQTHPGRYGNIDKKYDAAIDKVFQATHGFQPSGVKDDPNTADVDESKAPVSAPWRTAWNLLTDQAGLKPDAAALLASKWFASSINREGTNPLAILKMLGARNVSVPVQRRIIDQAYGRGTYGRVTRNPAGYMAQQLGQGLGGNS